MRKLVLFIAASLDGFIARKDGSIDWLFSDADYGYSKFFKSIGTVIVGRKTYEQALGFGEYPFKGKKCYVFTAKQKGRKDANATFVSEPVSFSKKLLKSAGKDVWLVGGSEIISLLMNAGLVAEIIVSIHPIILGSGIPLFNKIKKEITLRLIGSKEFRSGLVQLHYQVV